MDAYVADIEKATHANNDFRRVLFTGEHAQLVLMTLRPGEEIGLEVHEDVDQFFRVEAGEARLIADGREHWLREGNAAVVRAGTAHNVVNAGLQALKLYTIYTSPKHPDGAVEQTKADAERAEASTTPRPA